MRSIWLWRTTSGGRRSHIYAYGVCSWTNERISICNLNITICLPGFAEPLFGGAFCWLHAIVVVRTLNWTARNEKRTHNDWDCDGVGVCLCDQNRLGNSTQRILPRIKYRLRCCSAAFALLIRTLQFDRVHYFNIPFCICHFACAVASAVFFLLRFLRFLLVYSISYR